LIWSTAPAAISRKSGRSFAPDTTRLGAVIAQVDGNLGRAHHAHVTITPQLGYFVDRL